jgi:hypothetical protein
LRTALGHTVEQAEALQASYNSSEQELQELRDAALETCRSVEEGEAQAGSSLASRLRALGSHVTERMRWALHLGVQKALGVVRSHYEVNFEALAEGYVVPEGVEDEVAMERVDALAADAAGSLAEAFRSSSSRTLLTPPLLPPEDSWALGPFLFVYQYSGRAAFVNKQVVFVVNICRCEMKSFVYCAFCFSFFLSRF